MTKRLLIPIFLSICFFQQAFAQVPVAVQVETPVPSLVSGSSMVCPAGVVADAGTTVQALDPAAQSNDVEFLCFNDVLSITHQGGQTFGDPDPVSAPGISYHFYDCSPTVSGPDLATLLTDPCILVDPGNGNPYATQFPTTAIDIDGNADFVNNGGVQAFFNGGNPIELFFAPVTIDDWANAVYETDGVGGDSGPCINSNTNDAFRVVYLNEIQGTNIDNGANGPCGGSFVAQGGLPEFDPMAIYTSISITLSTDPAVMGTTPLPFNVGHGEVVTFTVPQAGVYDIVLEDGKSCAATFQVDMNNCIEVETVIGNETANTGDQVCVPVTATGFDDLFGFQFTILFDETVLTFDNITLDQLPTTLSTSNPNPGEIIFSWVEDGLNGVTLAGTNILFEICFTAIGAPGTSSDLTFTGAPAPGGTPIEFSSFSGPRGYDLTNGSVSIAGGGGNIMVDFGVCTSLAGNTSGSFTASATGGSGTYSLDWEEIGNPGNTGSTTIPLGLVENLGPGFYSVTVTDNAGASVVENVLIPTTEPLSVQTIPTNPQCVNTGDGQIQLNVDDGVGPYTIEWSTGPGDDGVTLLQNLSPDDYTVTVTDNLGCVVSSSNSLQTPDLDITLINQQNITCATLGQSTGSLTVEATGDNPGFGYSWENSAMANIGSTATIDNLPSDTYTVTATDGNGCSIVANFTITEPVGPTIQSFDSISVSCPNDPSGSLTVNALPGDVPVASFAWDDPNNQTTQTASMLNAGTYTVTVTDDDGCSVIESASLFAPAPLDIVVTVTPPSCPGDATGVVAFTNNSPTDITFEWFDGNTAFQTIPGLTCGNSYSVTISDVNMCETIVIDTLMECPEVIDANLDTIPTPLTSCHLSNSVLCDAQLTAIPSGGTAGTGVYSMTWSSGESFTDVTSATATGLCQGLQYVIIGDANCSDTTFFTVNSPPPLTFDLGQLGSTPPSCFGDSNGTAMVGATGGTPGYSFLWDDGTVGETIGGLTSGNYNVTVTDANGCSNDISIGVSENPLLVAQILDFIDPSCAGGDDGQITVGQTGGVVGAFNYNWSPNSDDNNSLAANLTSGNYSITVTDANGCTSEVSQALSEPTPIDAVIPMPVEPICNGGQTVITVESATGGASLSHTFSVDFGPPQFLTSSIPVLAGEHLIQVFDSLGCFTEYTITIDEPNQVVVAFENDIEELELGDSIRLTPVVIPSPNVPIDTLIWSPFTDLSCAIFNNDSICQYVWASPLETTTYELIAIDTNGCEARAEVTVDIDRNRNVYIPNAFSPDGNGVNDILKIFTGVGVERINYFRIYDRWGEQVYAMNDFVSSDNPLEGWDGRMNGKDMNSGIYVYIAEVVFADGRVLLYRGDVALVR